MTSASLVSRRRYPHTHQGRATGLTNRNNRENAGRGRRKARAGSCFYSPQSSRETRTGRGCGRRGAWLSPAPPWRAGNDSALSLDRPGVEGNSGNAHTFNDAVLRGGEGQPFESSPLLSRGTRESVPLFTLRTPVCCTLKTQTRGRVCFAPHGRPCLKLNYVRGTVRPSIFQLHPSLADIF